MVRYRVLVGYKKFTFKSREAALDFAETAFEANEDQTDGVELQLIRIEEEAENNE